MQDEVARFVASLAIPADRKAIVLAELTDHVACATDAAAREGRDVDAAAREALGNLEVLKRSLEAIEPAFRVTRLHAFARALVAAVLVAIVLDQGGPLMRGLGGAVVAISLGALLAPPRVLELLRAELRAPRVAGTIGRGVPIGPAVTYAYTLMSTPFIIWIGLIGYRATLGTTDVDVPVSAFALMAAIYSVLIVEAVRARRAAVA
jgi:hypothetical protein